MSMSGPIIGITGTCPVEALYAGGARVVDLNNAFVTHPRRDDLLAAAHAQGFAPTQCAWTRGIHAVATAAGDDLAPALDLVVVVGRGDCSQNRMLADLIPMSGGPPTALFAFPHVPDDLISMRRAIAGLAARVGADWAAVEAAWARLSALRGRLTELERRCWQDGTVRGSESQSLLIRSTDFGGDPVVFAREVAALLEASARRAPVRDRPRLALFGVPPILLGLTSWLEQRGAQVVLHEAERDFAQVDPADDLVGQYASRYAYPYSIHRRLARFLPELDRREVDGVIVYQQSFCHHNAELGAVRRALAGIPAVEIEADAQTELDASQRMRLETLLGQLFRGDRARPREPRAVDGARLGIDIGSRRTKVLWRQGDRLERRVLDTVPFLRDGVARHAGALQLRWDALAPLLGLDDAAPDLPDRVVTTGYGRYAVRLEGTVVIPEIHAHARGACVQTGLADFVLVDLGGQDVKVIEVSGGVVRRFLLNDKCAAGSGRYLENMARLLDLPLEVLLAQGEAPVDVAATCATFGETEVITHLVEGIPISRIAAGVNRSVARRLLPTLADMAPGAPLVLSGGAAGDAIAAMLGQRSGREVLRAADPVWNGALGCVEWEE
jgi:(R)-2-hydroxyacyl-CoA dehydratese activating ATPase